MFCAELGRDNHPLMYLTRKGLPEKVKWNNLHQRPFDELRVALSSDPVLQGADYDKEFILQMDALYQGIGAVLRQETNQKGDRPIAFFSRKLWPREKNLAAVLS